jgi:hypothetical protein
VRAWLLAMALPAAALAQEVEIQLAPIQRDQQAAEFSNSGLHELRDQGRYEPLRPDERALRARERETARPQPARPAAPASPPALPLPGGARPGVDAVAPPRFGG